MSNVLVTPFVQINVTRAGRLIGRLCWRTDGLLDCCGMGFCTLTASLMCVIHFALRLAGPGSQFSFPPGIQIVITNWQQRKAFNVEWPYFSLNYILYVFSSLPFLACVTSFFPMYTPLLLAIPVLSSELVKDRWSERASFSWFAILLRCCDHNERRVSAYLFQAIFRSVS